MMRFALSGRSFALAAVAALVSSAVALAAKEEKGAPPSPLYVKDGAAYREAKPEEVAKAAHGHDAHGKGGGLDLTGIKRYDLGIYTLIVFGLLLFVLSRFAWPHIRAGLEKREQNILSALEQAKQDAAVARTELESARRELAK